MAHLGSTKIAGNLTVSGTVRITSDQVIRDTLDFGYRASGDVEGRYFFVEGAAEAANGEAYGRWMFTEHNATDASADLYGVSFSYQGDTTPITLPSGHTVDNGGNATWALKRHSDSLNGDFIMSGSRASSDVAFYGRVGMGTSNPQSSLHIEAPSPALRIRNTSDSGTGSIEFWDNQSGTSQAGMIRFDDTANVFELQGNANGIIFRNSSNTFPSSGEAMRLDTNSDFLIGTTNNSPHTSPNSDEGIVLRQGQGVGGFIGVSRNDSTPMSLNRNGSEGNNIEFNKDGNVRAGIGIASNDLTIDVGGSEKMRIQDVSGNVGIGTSDPDAILETSQDAGSVVGALFTNRNQSGSSDEVSINFGMGRTVDTAIRSMPCLRLRKERQWTGDPVTVDASLIFSSVQSESTNERMRITSDGNVGIGTPSPKNLGGQTHLTINQESSGTQVAGISLEIGGTEYAGMLTYPTNGEGLRIYSAQTHPMTFFVGGAERARITSGGNVYIGTTSQLIAGRFCLVAPQNAVVAKTNAGAGTYEAFAGVRNGNSGKVASWWYDENTQVGDITITATETQYNSPSDYRLKEDFRPVANASDRVLSLNPKNFAWKSTKQRIDGFLAHEVQTVVPEAVTGEKDAVDVHGNPVYQGMDHSKLVPVLTAALQEALTKIEDLETRIKALEK